MKIKIKREYILSIIAVILGLIAGALLMIVTGNNPFSGFSYLFRGGLMSIERIGNTIAASTPLIFSGLSVAFAFRTGLFNIGSAGQMLMGGVTASAIALNLNLPKVLLLPIMFIGAFVAGGLWGSISGFLKAKFNVHEVVSTIMLNWIASNLASYMVNGPLAVGSGTPKSPEIAEASKLPVILKVQATELSIGIFIAVAVAIIMYILIEKITTGYKLKAVGFNPHAAEYGGISIRKSIILTMAISGALAGMAGIVDLIGVPPHRFVGELTGGRGFDGITIALIGRNNPIGIIFAALLIAALRTGSNAMQIRAQIPNDIVSIIQGIVIFLVAAERIVSTLISWKRKKGVTAI